MDPDEYGRLRQHLDQVLRDNRVLEERNRALSSRAQPGGMDQAVMVRINTILGYIYRSFTCIYISCA